MCVDIIDKELLKKRRNYIAVQEILSLGAGILIISEYKEKNFVYYEINTTVFDELIIWVNQFGGKKV